MTDRRPLVALPEPERVERLAKEWGLDADLLPLTLTPEERQAAQRPGLPLEPPMPDATPEAPALKSGWKTTEAWALMLLLALAAYALHMLAGLLPFVAGMPGMPIWLAPLLPLAAAPLLWVAHKAVAAYGEQRKELKLPPDPTEAGTEAPKP